MCRNFQEKNKAKTKILKLYSYGTLKIMNILTIFFKLITNARALVLKVSEFLILNQRAMRSLFSDGLKKVQSRIKSNYRIIDFLKKFHAMYFFFEKPKIIFYAAVYICTFQKDAGLMKN